MDYANNTYRAKCLRVIDGDTVHLEVDLGLRVKRTLDVRLVGIDAPETKGASFSAGKASKEYLENLLMPIEWPSQHRVAAPLIVRFEKGKSFDRWLGRIFLVRFDESETTDEYFDVQAEMVKAGHAEEVKR